MRRSYGCWFFYSYSYILYNFFFSLYACIIMNWCSVIWSIYRGSLALLTMRLFRIFKYCTCRLNLRQEHYLPPSYPLIISSQNTGLRYVVSVSNLKKKSLRPVISVPLRCHYIPQISSFSKKKKLFIHFNKQCAA